MRFTTGKMEKGKLEYVSPKRIGKMLIAVLAAAVILIGAVAVYAAPMEESYCIRIAGKAVCYPTGPIR